MQRLNEMIQGQDVYIEYTLTYEPEVNYYHLEVHSVLDEDDQPVNIDESLIDRAIYESLDRY